MTDTLKTRGGARPGAGRPHSKNPLIRKAIRLSKSHWKKAELLGDGAGPAAGIRKKLDK